MKQNTGHNVRKLLIKYRLMKISEVTLLSLAGSILTFTVAKLLPASNAISFSISLLIFFIILFVRIWQTQLHRASIATVVSFLNNRYESLEQSTDLLLKQSTDLPLLQRLQQQKVTDAFQQIYPQINLPHRLLQSVLILAVALGTSALLSFQINSKKKSGDAPLVSRSANKLESKLPPSIKSFEITVTPPTYTARKSYTTNNPHLEIPELSKVRWNISFTSPVKKSWIIFSGDTVSLKGQKFTIEKSFTTSSFYQIAWQSDSIIKTSDFYKIEVLPDQAPEVSVNDLPQFTELSITDKTTFQVKASLADDYSVSDAYIIATVSKGSGESVKFREEKLKFTSPEKINGKSLSAQRHIDLMKLGMEPGDELYFYVEATDNKNPKANRSRTETYFIQLLDTAQQEISVEGGLGVDLMPEYFRSQRQIIIDSEKLLKERKSIKKEEFNARSNELGYDQKVLRLKYGEFLGEEFESGIGLQSSPEVHEEEEEDITKKYGHVHDTENEHNLVPEKKHEEHDHHNHEEGEKENPMATFMHVHDDPEEATFFSQSIRAKLKAALTIMWDAELHLRLFDPQTSLPYQYKALKLLKEISNDSRIYVHKTGFDPPPIKEEKRLTGDLSEAKTTQDEKDLLRKQNVPAIRQALKLTEQLIANSTRPVHQTENDIFRKAGNELAALALENPAVFLDGLTIIKSITETEETDGDQLIKLRTILWKAIPPETQSPTAQNRNVSPLDRSFIHNLDALKNE